jgi:hypothetical protein
MGHSAYRGGRDDRERERAEETDIEGRPFLAYFEDVQVQDCMDRVSVSILDRLYNRNTVRLLEFLRSTRIFIAS